MMISSNQGSLTLSCSTFDFAKFREIVTSIITMHNWPFNKVEWEGVRTVLYYLRNDVQTILKNTIKSDILKFYGVQKKKFKNMLQTSHSRVSLTSNLWISLAINSYLASTVHFINKNWILQKYILTLSYMPSPHIGIALENKF